MKIHPCIFLASLALPFGLSAAENDIEKQQVPPSNATMTAPTTESESKDQPKPQTSTAEDISGTYLCKGYDPYNKRNYSFPVVEINKRGDLFNIQWQDDAGNPIMIGNAVTNATIPNAFAIIYWPTKPDYYLVGQYVKNQDGSLQSNWIVAGQKLLGTETCTKK